MPGKSSSPSPGADSPSQYPNTRYRATLQQLAFETEFFQGVLCRHPNYVDVLRVLSNNLTRQDRVREGLEIDKRLVHLEPHDALAHYNLACRHARLRHLEAALKTLRRALELGYNDLHYLQQDSDFDNIRHDPRFRQLLREFTPVARPDWARRKIS
jgi:tetratricopeptide (TPR) repeat protein